MKLFEQLNTSNLVVCYDGEHNKDTWFVDDKVVPRPDYVSRVYLDAHPEGSDRGGYVIWVQSGDAKCYLDELDGTFRGNFDL